MKLRDFGKKLKDFVIDSLRGELPVRLGAVKYFLSYTALFLMVWLMILIKIGIEGTFGRVEKNKAVLNELKIYHTEKMVQLAKMGRMSTASELLKGKNSTVGFPVKPADRLDAKEKN